MAIDLKKHPFGMDPEAHPFRCCDIASAGKFPRLVKFGAETLVQLEALHHQLAFMHQLCELVPQFHELQTMGGGAEYIDIKEKVLKLVESHGYAMDVPDPMRSALFIMFHDLSLALDKIQELRAMGFSVDSNLWKPTT